jgi:DNA-binding transcriptional MocR family regulator
MNLPPAGPAAARLSDTLAKLRRRSDLSDCLTLAPPPGTPADRQATADWLRGHARLPDADWRRLLLCNGAQQAMALTLDALCRPGDTIMVEAASFFGIRAIAEYRRLGLAGLAMDRHGVLPEALDRTAAETGSRLVYLQPTLQSRRAEIAAVARSRDLWILEDDVYGPLAWQAQPHGDETPLACLAPERCFYAGSLSKALTPGLRAGFLMAPSADHFETLSGAMRAVCYSVSALTPLIASQWIKDGTAAEILKENAAETTARTRLALVILAEAAEAPSFPTSLHIWLPMTELDAERVVSRTLRQDVVLTPPSSFSFDARKLSGLRICVSAIPDRAGLEQGLRIVAAAMRSDREAPMQSLV